MSCARPIAMPPDTPMPCSTKLNADSLSGAAPCAKASPLPDPCAGPILRRGDLSLFAELSGDQMHHGGHGLGFVRSAGLHADGRAHARREQHHGEHAARACAPAVPDERNVATESRRHLHDLGAGSRVKTEAIGDLDETCLHSMQVTCRQETLV